MNLAKAFSVALKMHSSNIIFKNFQGKKITYNLLYKYVQYQAKKIACQVEPLSRIVIICNNSYHMAINILAGLFAGCIVIPISEKYGYRLVVQIINTVDPDLIITDFSLLKKNKGIEKNVKL